MQIDDIRDPMVRKAAETFVRSTGKPLDRWIVGPADEQLLRELLIHRNFLAARKSAPPSTSDLFTIEMALRGLGVRQIKGLVAGGAHDDSNRREDGDRTLAPLRGSHRARRQTPSCRQRSRYPLGRRRPMWHPPPSPPPTDPNAPLGISTIGEAHDLGWRLRVWCDAGKQEGMKRHRECTASQEIDLATLVWTRSRDCEIATLSRRFACIRCGSRFVRIFLEPPAVDHRQRARA